jgi:putative N-acetyltransferase (TIGR04045 family)
VLETTRPFGAPVRAYVSPSIAHGIAREAWEIEAYWQLRREIFCDELGIFAGPVHERDRHDLRALPIVAVSYSAGNPEAVVGVVRVYAAEGGVWYGGRLGVVRGYRARPQVGSGLIACAVRSAATHGCQRFLAHVLAENTAYFGRNHFRVLSELELWGKPHVLMQADLTAFGIARPTRPSRTRAGSRTRADGQAA